MNSTLFPPVVELLKKMISFDTVNAGISGKECPEAGLVGYLEDLAGEADLETLRLAVPGQSDELLILHRRNPALPWLLFDSHLDTVSVDGMTIEPFAGREADGRIWGRGACDTKGTGAAMFCALEEYSSTPSPEAGNNIALLFSVDEEWGMSGIRAFNATHLDQLDFRPKGAVIGEPTGLRPVVAHNGVVRYVVQTHGVAAHSSNPALGRSAVSDMARLITYLEDEFIPTCSKVDPLTGRAQCSINVIRGGTAANIIPDLCEIQVDRRSVPGETSSEVVDSFGSAIAAFENRRPSSDITWKVTIDTPALEYSRSEDFSGRLTEVLEGLGRKGAGTGVTYATHAGELSEAGIPSVVIGPGDIAQGHTKDEWIDVGELTTGVDIYRSLMELL